MSTTARNHNFNRLYTLAWNGQEAFVLVRRDGTVSTQYRDQYSVLAPWRAAGRHETAQYLRWVRNAMGGPAINRQFVGDR